MKYSEYVTLKASDDGRTKIVQKLSNSPRDVKLQMFRDYYDGKQFQTGQIEGETRFSRSGKEMWKPFDSKNPARGLKNGELKVWNLIKMAIGIYRIYTRGDEKEDVKINVSRKSKTGLDVDEELTHQQNMMFEDLNTFVMNMVVQFGVSSVDVLKYTRLMDERIIGSGPDAITIKEKEMLKTMRLLDASDDIEAVCDSVDPIQVEPLYIDEGIRGFIRYYRTDGESARSFTGDNRMTKKEYLYWECWEIENDGSVVFSKYIDKVKFDDGKYPHRFLPYILAMATKDEFAEYGLNGVEECITYDLIDLQDDVNAYLTDLTIIFRKVALPLLKLTDKFLLEAEDKDIEKVKQWATKLNTMAGNLIMAPIERLSGDGPAPSHIAHLNDIFEQFHRITNIPKSVFNSEGLGNVANETLESLFKSLGARISSFRTGITQALKRIAKMNLIASDKWSNDLVIDVNWPTMVVPSKIQEATIIEKIGARLPKIYALEKILELLNDSERLAEVLAHANDEDAQMKAFTQAVETARAIGNDNNDDDNGDDNNNNDGQK